MDYIIHAPEMDLPASLNEVDAYCVYAAFEKITDGRCKRGIRYPVALILTLIVLAKLMGEPKLSGVSQWVRLRGTWLKRCCTCSEHAGLRPPPIPMSWSVWMRGK